MGTYAGGIPEAVYHEGNGLLALPQNPEALAGALSDLIKNKKRRKQLGQHALKTVKNFDISRTFEKTVALYKEILVAKDD